MNIKNLFLTIGITCSATACILNTQPKTTIPVKAANETNMVEPLVSDKVTSQGEGAMFEYMSTGDTTEISVTNFAFYIYVLNDEEVGELPTYDYYFFNITFISFKEETANATIKPNFVYSDKLYGYTSNLQNSFVLTNNQDVDDFWQDVNNATPGGNYLIYEQVTNYDHSYSTIRTTNTINFTNEEKGNKYCYTQLYYINNFTLTDAEYILFNREKPVEPVITNYFYTADLKSNRYIVNYDGVEMIDIPGLMLKIISMPFTFISQAFNVTLFPGTPYQLNIGQFILGLIALMTILFIIKVFTGGLDIIGNVTSSAKNATKPKGEYSNTTTIKTNSKGEKTIATTERHKKK